MEEAPSKRAVVVGRVCYTKSDGTVRVYDLNRNIVIGRGQDCDIRIKQGTVSRVHCRITRVEYSKGNADAGEEEGDESEYWLENLSTTNHTEVNYAACRGRTKLNENDIITIGERDFVFKFVSVQMDQAEYAAFVAATRAAADGGGGEGGGIDVTPPPTSFPSTAESDAVCMPGLFSSPAATDDKPARERRIRSPRPVPRNETSDSSSLWALGCIPTSLNPLGVGFPSSSSSSSDQVDGEALSPASPRKGHSVRFSSGLTSSSSTNEGGAAARRSSKQQLTPEQRDSLRRQRAKEEADAAMERVERARNGDTPTKSGGWGLWFM